MNDVLQNNFEGFVWASVCLLFVVVVLFYVLLFFVCFVVCFQLRPPYKLSQNLRHI